MFRPVSVRARYATTVRSMVTEEEYVRTVRERIDAYERTVQALVCFRSAMCWDDDRHSYREDNHFGVGRRMDREAEQEHPLTPDVVVQFEGETGLVAEMKLTASSDQDFKKAEAQVMKYDQELEGWWTENQLIASHQVACVVPDSHVSAAMQFFRDAGPFDRGFLLVSAGRDDASIESFMQFERRQGAFAVERLNEKFGPRTPPIPLEKAMPQFGIAIFYDAEPPCVEHTMFVLWSRYFPHTDRFDTRLEPRGSRAREQIQVELDDACRFLRERFSVCSITGNGEDPRQPSVPEKEWVRKAMDHFVEIGRADHDQEDRDVFWVSFSLAAFGTDLEDFAKQVYRHFPPDWALPEESPQLPID